MSRATAPLVLLTLACAPSTPEPSLVIRDVTVIPMTGVDSLPAHTVVIRGDRIVVVGPARDTEAPPGALVIEGAGRYLIPGLIEMHGHTSKTRASALPLYVAHGVTTLRDAGSEHAEVLRWRAEIRRGERVGPRMLLAGPYLESLRNIERMRRDPPEARVEPFERARIPIGSPEDARRVIDSLARLELDFLKIRTVQDRETYLALGAAADRAGLRLTGHVVSPSGSDLLAAGQDLVDHGFPPTLDTLPAATRRAFWRELARRDVAVVPTLVTVTESGLRPTAYLHALARDTAGAGHPLRPYLSAFLALDWQEQADEASDERLAVYARFWPMWLRYAREMREEGVRLLAGSDVAVLNIFPGATLHEEIRLLADSVGLTPQEALAAATRRSAEWLGLADSVGSVAPGKVADLVLLRENPLADLRRTRAIDGVVLRGRLYDRRGLDSLLTAVREMPDLRANDWLR